MAGSKLLSVKKCDSAKPGESLNDGEGLRLDVTAQGRKTWTLRYSFAGKRHKLKLGNYPSLSLADARDAAAKAQAQILKGIDPREARKPKLEIKTLTFGEFVEDQLPRITAKFENPKHVYQWYQSFRTYAKPKAIWETPLEHVSQSHVEEVIAPLWREKRETMSRLRGRIENIINIAKARKLYHGDNPASWDIMIHVVDELSHSERKPKHHTALEYEALPEFWKALERRKGLDPVCLKLVILTACRSTEARKADWSEIDLENALWEIPAERMKARQPHLVPLPKQAVDMLKALPGERFGAVFLNPSKGKPLSDGGMLALLRRMGNDALNKDGQRITSHGFRSTFRDWAEDCTDYDPGLAETQLAHTGDALQKAYRRRSAVQRRAQMMQQYADYVSGVEAASNVVNLEARR